MGLHLITAATVATWHMRLHRLLPPAHPQRTGLHNEVHARPPGRVRAPLAISHLVMMCDTAQREASRAHVAKLLRDHHLPPPDAPSTYVCIEVGVFRLRWELHTEFVTWTFSRPIEAHGFGEVDPVAAVESVPMEWLATLPGECLQAMHLWVLPNQPFSRASLVKHVLNEETLVGSKVADGHGEVYTDFTIHADGFSRVVLLAGGEIQPRLGRLVQQISEIDTYRMAALMGLPAACEAADVLRHAECELASLAGSICEAGRNEEPQLLDRLTRLAAKVERDYAATHSRLAASASYFDLVDRRIADIGEERLNGLQTVGAFISRRLTPARATCASAVRRQDALSQRVSRISNLLRTRVEVEQQQSSQNVLATMNRRQGLQLQLQATVESLSVAAITYYIVCLVSVFAKGAHALGWPFSAEGTAAFSIPVAAFCVWQALRSLHHRAFTT